ncbi:MAG: hypothetical protein V4525_03975 [Pseudomonadota bacterium]
MPYFFDLKNKYSLIFYIGILSFCIILIRYVGAINPDIEWLTLCAKRLLSGGKFYDDFYEINSPSSIVLYFISVFFENLLHIPTYISTSIMVVLVIWMVIALCNLIIRQREYHLPSPNDDHLNLFLLSFSLCYMVMPYLGLAQKDHYIAICMFPYALILFSPVGFERKNKRYICVNFFSSLLLGIVILLKPYYILTMLGLHGFAYVKFKKIRFSIIDISIIFIFCISFIGFYWSYYITWYPIAKEGIKLYKGYNAPIGEVIMNLLWNLTLPYFLAISIYKDKRYHSYGLGKDFCYMLCGLALCSIPAYLIQKKGWYYQLLPVILPLWIIIFFPVLNKAYKSSNKYQLLKIIGLILIFLYIFQSWFCKSFYSPGEISNSRKWAKEVASLLKPDDGFMCISHSMECPFALKHLGDYKYVSRQAIILSSAGSLNLWRKGEASKEFFNYYFKRDLNNLSQDIVKGNAKVLVIEWKYLENGNIEIYGDSEEFKALLNTFKFKLVNYIKDYPHASQATWIFLRQ